MTEKKNKVLLILLIGLVVLIAGASILYTRLSDTVERDQLAEFGGSQTGGTISGESAGNSAGSEDSAGDADSSGNADSADSTDSAEQEKYPAPDITIFDAEGNEVSLSDFQGKPVILNFWASWCGPCKSEMPDFNDAYLQYGAKIHFLMVNMTDGYSETQETGQAFIDGLGYVFPVYFDLQQDAAITYGVSSIPTTYFIDAEGYFVAQARGAIDAETLQVGIDLLNQ